jgi:heme oxygenase
MNADFIEQFAIRVALGNNGGTWAKHYTPAQQEHWRQFIRDLERPPPGDGARTRQASRAGQHGRDRPPGAAAIVNLLPG